MEKLEVKLFAESSKNSELPDCIQGHHNLLLGYKLTMLHGIHFFKRTFLLQLYPFIYFNGFKDLWIRFYSFSRKYILSGSHSCYLPSTEDASLQS